jgi:hypothetical protein
MSMDLSTELVTLTTRTPDKKRDTLKRYLPAWLAMGALLALILPYLLRGAVTLVAGAIGALPGLLVDAAEIGLDAGEAVVVFVVDTAEDAADRAGDLFADDPVPVTVIAPLFTPEVAHWEAEISRWSETYDLDPNLLATVMQIESCGHPTVNSHAGAQGLFQVMPFHFDIDEDMLDPDTNAMRGAGVLNDCLRRSGGDPGLAMACYNGGPRVLSQPMSAWLDEPRRYYYWGTGIYADALQGAGSSDRLTEWLDAGGARLCDLASAELGR